jgi:hypothetical protein
MLTDSALKFLKSKEKMCKVSDRDGMYVRVARRAPSRSGSTID